MMKLMLYWIVFTLHQISLQGSNSDVFTNIYEKDVWGNGSGPGSKLENNLEYVEFINNFIKKTRSVLW